MENEVIVLPQIHPTYYNGQKVLSSNQLAALFKCKRQNITDIYRNHKAEFVEGVDYFKLVGEDLKELKERFARQVELRGTRQVDLAADGSEKIPPFSGSASALYVWTKSGAFKLAEYIGTDKAKMFYAGLAMAYFRPVKPKQLQLP